MNEIQRFKKNRMIPKGLYGLKPHEILGGAVNGETVGYVNIPGKGYLAIDAKGNAYTTRNETKNGGFSRKTTFIPVKLTNYDRQQIYKAVSRNDGVTSWIRDHSNNIANYWKAKGAPVVTKPAIKQTADEPAATVDTGKEIKKGVGRGRIVAKRPLKSQEQWDSDFQTMTNGLSSQQRMYLDSLGIDTSNALAMLASINKHLGNNNLVEDNKWGEKSQGVLDALLRYMPKDYQNDDMKQGLANEVNLPDDAVIDAPDPFGYKTSNTYEGDNFANKLKGMGIGSNADLINFMHNSGKEGWKGDAWLTQFRSDVDRALGGDYSDANIRKVFGTQGKWGRGFLGRGDFGDFQNALQTNAGAWNGAYELKQNDVRMDVARQQYATKQAQQFTVPQLSKPTVEDPSKKFMVGKIQTNTLGNVGAGSLGDDWMKYATQTGYLPS